MKILQQFVICGILCISLAKATTETSEVEESSGDRKAKLLCKYKSWLLNSVWYLLLFYSSIDISIILNKLKTFCRIVKKLSTFYSYYHNVI